ncbi:hypothetical protein [Aquipuribacter nitratireducens]|uniref:Uncharacterized protein n=1 Tax=Aquipuribacter nitratireducens TaxID=650104 RepID=A0ABW0GKA5_9MICO
MGSSIVAGLAGAALAAGETTGELAEVELPVPPLVFGIGTLVIFLILLGITYSFKNVAHRQ